MSKMVLLTFMSNVWEMCVPNHSIVFTLRGTSPVPGNNKVAVPEGIKESPDKQLSLV